MYAVFNNSLYKRIDQLYGYDKLFTKDIKLSVSKYEPDKNIISSGVLSFFGIFLFGANTIGLFMRLDLIRCYAVQAGAAVLVVINL